MTDDVRWEGFVADDDRLRSRRRVVLDELIREFGNRHTLDGRIVQVEAFFTATDDVIVRLDNGAFAHVHPTWTGHVELPGYPQAAVLGREPAVLDFMARWEANYRGRPLPAWRLRGVCRDHRPRSAL